MSKHEVYQQAIRVAPVRERGLKSGIIFREPCSSRRSRKGAWIEITIRSAACITSAVAPVRERGLKWQQRHTPDAELWSLP